jgi:hypothetical protein
MTSRFEIIRLIQGATDPAIRGARGDAALAEFVAVLVGDVAPTSAVHAMNTYCNTCEAIDKMFETLMGVEIDCYPSDGGWAKVWPASSQAAKRQACDAIVDLVVNNYLAGTAVATDPSNLGFSEVPFYVVQLIEHILTVDTHVTTQREAAEIYIAAVDELGASLRRPEVEDELQ